jgi:mono/diheme cytochrome c family protein
MVQREKLAAALIGLWAVAGITPAMALDNLSQGKTVQQVFASDCAICHNEGKKLGASMRPGQLATFLAEHYTTSKAEAAALAGYLTGAGEPERKPSPRRTRAKSGSRKPATPTSN